MKKLLASLACAALLLTGARASLADPWDDLAWDIIEAVFTWFDPVAQQRLPPVIRLPPVQAADSRQQLDGYVGREEYAEGREVFMQDFLGGEESGTMRMVWAGTHLEVGIRVDAGDCSPASTTTRRQSCNVALFFDDERMDTLRFVPFDSYGTPGPEDQAFVLDFTGKVLTMHSYRGTGNSANPWAALPSGSPLAWQTDSAIGQHDGVMHIELNINLPVVLAEPPDDGEAMGFAASVFHTRPTPSGHLHVWPIDGKPHDTVIANGVLPGTYATIIRAVPSRKPTGFMTYNVGWLSWWAGGNAGALTPADLGAHAMSPDVHVACMQEIWADSERDDIEAIIEAHAMSAVYGWKRESEDPGFIPPGDDDTGLLLVSRGPVRNSRVMQYTGNQTGSDWWKEKGAIWARVATSNAQSRGYHYEDIPGLNIRRRRRLVYDDAAWLSDEYVDVYCTHLNAACDFFAGAWFGCDDPDETAAVRANQVSQLASLIDDTRLSDRPAVAMGDFNVNSRSLELLKSGGEFDVMVSSLGVSELTDFEVETSWYSDRHDVGLGFYDAAKNDRPVTGTAPVLVHELSQLAGDNANAGVPWSIFGEGTDIGDADAVEFGCLFEPGGAPESKRLDNIFILPADPGPESMPRFTVAGHPHAVVQGVLASDDGECGSDHSSVFSEIEIVEVGDTLLWNPRKDHAVTYVRLANIGHVS